MVYAQVDDTIVKSIVVKGNMSIQLRYAPCTDAQEIVSTDSCASSIRGFGAISLTLMAVSFLLYKKVGKKAGEE